MDQSLAFQECLTKTIVKQTVWFIEIISVFRFFQKLTMVRGIGYETGVLVNGRLMAVPAIGNTCAAGTTTRFSSKCYAPQVIPSS